MAMTPAPEWDWGDPAGLAGPLDEFLLDMAVCKEIEPVVSGVPFTRDDLARIAVTGVEFASWKTKHPAGVGSDLVGLSGTGVSTEPGHIYRVDGDAYFTQLDICQPLPFADGCLDWVYAEHLIEHVSLTEGIGWLREVRRILAPGGMVRLTTPDLARYVDGYRDGDRFFAKHRRRLHTVGVGPPMPQRRAFMFNQMFYLWGHRWIYDLDELRFALTEAGFDPDAIEVRAFREGGRADVAALDQAVRADETIYVEVTR